MADPALPALLLPLTFSPSWRRGYTSSSSVPSASWPVFCAAGWQLLPYPLPAQGLSPGTPRIASLVSPAFHGRPDPGVSWPQAFYSLCCSSSPCCACLGEEGYLHISRPRSPRVIRPFQPLELGAGNTSSSSFIPDKHILNSCRHNILTFRLLWSCSSAGAGSFARLHVLTRTSLKKRSSISPKTARHPAVPGADRAGRWHLSDQLLASPSYSPPVLRPDVGLPAHQFSFPKHLRLVSSWPPAACSSACSLLDKF
jgi:hypothetical protein